jgi:putative ABC transport system permease protein
MKMNQVLVVKRPVAKEFNSAQSNFIEEIKQMPEIKDVTYSTITPGEKNNWVKGGIYAEGKEVKNEMQFYQSNVAPGFFNFFNIKLLSGRHFFANETNWDGSARHVIINREAVSALGFENLNDVLGKKLIDSDNKDEIGEIVGVVDGYFQNSLDQEVRPTIFNCDKGGYYIFINIGNTNIANSIEKVNSCFKKLFKGQLFEFYFLDEYFNNQYKLYTQFNRCIIVFSLMAIVIACLSLLGMVVMVSNARTKEIGIRKVNGASIFQVMILLNRYFLKWIAIAFLIASPIAFYATNKWLQTFAYKTSISWWVFAAAGAAAGALALLTVSWQSSWAANRNPVEALRYE